jgi:hypothetical protein
MDDFRAGCYAARIRRAETSKLLSRIEGFDDLQCDSLLPRLGHKQF